MKEEPKKEEPSPVKEEPKKSESPAKKDDVDQQSSGFEVLDASI